MATTTVPCFKCNGSGEVAFRHVAEGVCFQCSGTGKLDVRKAAKSFQPVAPVVPDAERSTVKQWEYLARLANENDGLCRKWLYAAGAPCANQMYVSKAVMSKAIDMAKSGAAKAA